MKGFLFFYFFKLKVVMKILPNFKSVDEIFLKNLVIKELNYVILIFYSRICFQSFFERKSSLGNIDNLIS